MSSNSGNRKSMDDVLASIRRIIGADKKEGYDDLPEHEGGPGQGAPLALGTPIVGGDPTKSVGVGQNAQPQGGEPDALSLTPNMRVDFTKLTEDDGGRLGPPEGAAPHPVEPQPYVAGDDDEAVVIDEAALEDMIRRIVREELDARLAEIEIPEAAPAAEDPVARDAAMRRVVREELMGETGQNISRNVQKMIAAEVAKLSRGTG